MSTTLRMDPGGSPGPTAPPVGAASTPSTPFTQRLERKHVARRCPSCAQTFSGEARFCPFDGDSLVDAPDWNPAADPLLGTVVDGRYEVSSVIGEGGMGTVYEVRHVALGRRFALKVLRRDIADAEHTARFIQEAKAAAAIGHPNIVAVSDFGELVVPLGVASSRVPYFVMEHLTGVSLAATLRAERMIPPARAADILAQCARGLAAAHAAGVIHRDLKPDNVFLTRQGDREFVKLLDFGVAKMAGAGRLTRAGIVFGTPHYMSPEQAQGQSVDHRADIYALGVILYEALAGRVPFEADTYMAVLQKHMVERPEPLETAGGLGAIAMRCLEKDPDARFASMDELGAALEEAGTVAQPSGDAVSLRAARPSRPSGPSRRASESDEPAGVPAKIRVPGRALVAVGVAAVIAAGVAGVRALRSSAEAGRTASPTSTSASASAESVASTPRAAPPASSPTAAVSSDPAPPATAARVTAPARGTAGRVPTTTGPAAKSSARTTRAGGDVVNPWK